MRTDHINHAFLDPVVAGTRVDLYAHLGASSDDPALAALRGVGAVVMAGSAGRIREFAAGWSEENGGSEIVAFPDTDAFGMRYTAGVLFASHGMGMPSASVALQEAMRLVFFLAGGDLDRMDEVLWVRVGTSGGVGVPAGTVVVSSDAVMADLRPYRLLRGRSGEHWFDGTFPPGVRDAVVAASAGSDVAVTTGRTLSCNEYFLEASALDGAIRMATRESKRAWLQWLHDHGVRNIEMEGAVFAGYLNHWGFPRFAMICSTLLDCFEADQVTATPEQLQGFGADSRQVLFAYLRGELTAPDPPPRARPPAARSPRRG